MAIISSVLVNYAQREVKEVKFAQAMQVERAFSLGNIESSASAATNNGLIEAEKSKNQLLKHLTSIKNSAENGQLAQTLLQLIKFTNDIYLLGARRVELVIDMDFAQLPEATNAFNKRSEEYKQLFSQLRNLAGDDLGAALDKMSSIYRDLSVESKIKTKDEMGRVSSAVNAFVGKFRESIQQIAATSAFVNDSSSDLSSISFKMLSGTATVSGEAARAGQAGKGFAVVANGIKELARQTAEATQKIRNKIEGIQSSTAREISNSVVQCSQGIQEVNVNVAQSSTSAQEIAKDISQVNQSAQEMASGISQDISSTFLNTFALLKRFRMSCFLYWDVSI
ncbi:MAG: hypothetical protein KAI50_04110 [Desulfobacterales bacterium]|nr:hypothetical protein [Desulfobacterales bacterium]